MNWDTIWDQHMTCQQVLKDLVSDHILMVVYSYQCQQNNDNNNNCHCLMQDTVGIAVMQALVMVLVVDPLWRILDVSHQWDAHHAASTMCFPILMFTLMEVQWAPLISTMQEV